VRTSRRDEGYRIRRGGNGVNALTDRTEEGGKRMYIGGGLIALILIIIILILLF
jgi:hypothetical protein